MSNMWVNIWEIKVTHKLWVMKNGQIVSCSCKSGIRKSLGWSSAETSITSDSFPKVGKSKLNSEWKLIRNRLHRCGWRMLATKSVGDNHKMLLTVLTILITNIHYLFTMASRPTIQKILLTLKFSHQHPQIVTNFKSPTSLSPISPLLWWWILVFPKFTSRTYKRFKYRSYSFIKITPTNTTYWNWLNWKNIGECPLGSAFLKVMGTIGECSPSKVYMGVHSKNPKGLYHIVYMGVHSHFVLSHGLLRFLGCIPIWCSSFLNEIRF